MERCFDRHRGFGRFPSISDYLIASFSVEESSGGPKEPWHPISPTILCHRPQLHSPVGKMSSDRSLVLQSETSRSENCNCINNGTCAIAWSLLDLPRLKCELHCQLVALIKQQLALEQLIGNSNYAFELKLHCRHVSSVRPVIMPFYAMPHLHYYYKIILNE